MLDRYEALHLLDFDAWANGRIERALSASSAPIAPAIRLWAHIVAVQELWIARVAGEDYRKVVVWPEAAMHEAAMTELARRFEAVSARWRAYASQLTPAELEREVRFTSSAGVDQSDPVEAILRQVVNHGTHHRAQIASLLRAHGQSPPGIDYIMWRRELARDRSGSSSGIV